MLPYVSLLSTIFIALFIIRTLAWRYEEPPKVFYKQGDFQFGIFKGNDSMNGYLKLLHQEPDSILIGGRNVIYNISLEDLSEITEQRIVWNSPLAHTELCRLKGKSEDDCHNYIRVGGKLDDNTLYVCGTNAYKPQCQIYNITETPVVIKDNIEGRGKCPYDPKHNSSSIFVDGHLYSATVSDFSAGDPLIYREPLRTERSDLKQLNDPNFVGSVPYGNFMLFFFREPAVEYINCGKVIYSRVGRICKNDKGGPHFFGDRWTSFLKSRLNCSVPGEYPFYFNEIQSISEVVHGEYAGKEDKIIYAVFTTGINSITGSAVCAFSMSSIMATFDGAFKQQENMNSNWIPTPNHKVPSPRPGTCVNDSRTLPDTTVNFGKTHSLMDEAVGAFHSSPIFINTRYGYSMVSITVDSMVKTLSGEKVDVIYIGTDDGKILKVASLVGKSLSDVESIFIEELQISNDYQPIRKLSIIRPSEFSTKLLIISDTQIHTISLDRCDHKTSCIECISLQDPYCAWDTKERQCISLLKPFNFDSKNLIQNITSVHHKNKICPQNDPITKTESNEIPIDTTNKHDSSCQACTECTYTACSNEVHSNSVRDKIAVVYTADTLGIVIITGVMATLIIGFAAGYLCSRHFRTDIYGNMALRSNHQHNSLTESALNSEGSSAFLTPCSNNKAAALNLVVNVTSKTTNDKNAITENSKTLQKVKKTYI